MINVRRVGNWRGVEEFYTTVKRTMDETLPIIGKRVGLVGEKIIKDHIINQDLGWKPLSPHTIASKKSKGTPSRYANKTLIDTASYFRSITSQYRSSPHRAEIGVIGNPKGKNGVPIALYAEAHEEGNGVPQRKLYEPSLKELKEEVRTNKDLQPHHVFMNNYKRRLRARKMV